MRFPVRATPHCIARGVLVRYSHVTVRVTDIWFVLITSRVIFLIMYESLTANQSLPFGARLLAAAARYSCERVSLPVGAQTLADFSHTKFVHEMTHSISQEKFTRTNHEPVTGQRTSFARKR